MLRRPASLTCGTAMPRPRPVEPRRSRCSSVLKISRESSPVRSAAIVASSCRTCFLLVTLSGAMMPSGASRSQRSIVKSCSNLLRSAGCRVPHRLHDTAGDSHNSTFTLVPPHVPSAPLSSCYPLAKCAAPLRTQKDGTRKVGCTGNLQPIDQLFARLKHGFCELFMTRQWPRRMLIVEKCPSTARSAQGYPQAVRCKKGAMTPNY